MSQLPACRTKLTELQRNIAAHKSVVMDGRDIGTNVLPDADYKFFITASAKKRAERRYAELKDQGKDVTLEGVLADINKRDIKDTNRALNPLKKAEDAVEISTDNMNIEQTLKALMKML